MEILEHPKVCVAKGGPAENVPPRLPILTQEVIRNAIRRAILLLDRLGVKRLRSECADRAHKGVGVEELVDHRAAARVIERDRLAGEEGVFGRPRPIHRYVGATVKSNGRAALNRGHTAERPPTQQDVFPALVELNWRRP